MRRFLQCTIYGLRTSQDIRNLLQDWAEEISDCERIFIRASVSNRRIFLGYDGAILNKGMLELFHSFRRLFAV